MNISFDWLNDLIDTGLDAEATAAQLTRIGLAVEGIHPHADDYVLDIDLTSNRPDCLSHLGVARELSVATGSPVKLEGIVLPGDVAANSDLVQIEDPDLCLRFTARIIRNVKVDASPKWLVDRLEAIGERSINNVADITNYVMHELGQPMHAFDLDKLVENRIVVRRARAGETITTLDDVNRTLDGTMLAICDAERPVAVGGVMGGSASSISDATVNVLLEVAYFERANIRATSRKLNLATEASYRFERGVDIDNVGRASERATELICELGGGEVGEYVDKYPIRGESNPIVSPDISKAVKRLTGLTADEAECVRILDALGVKATSTGSPSYSFTSPSWRHDIAIEEDLVEEVARHIGYETIADELPPAYGAGEYQPTEYRRRLLRRALSAIGFDEAISYSFIDTRHDDVFESVPSILEESVTEKYITLRDSVVEGAVRMRSTILPGLLDAVRLNLNHQRRDLKLFEIGKVFAATAGEDLLPNERETMCIAITGGVMEQNRAIASRELDFYDAKGAVESALAAIGIHEAGFEDSDTRHLRKGQAATVSIGGVAMGTIGRLSDEIATSYKFKQPVFVAELDLESILKVPVPPAPYSSLARFPAITRDVSLLVKRNVTFRDIRQAIVEQAFELCRSVSFVDVYEGKGLDHDQRSVTIRLEYRSNEGTLIEQEVETLHKLIIASVEQKLGVKQRT